MSQNGLINKRRAKKSLSYVVCSLHDTIFLHYWFHWTLFEMNEYAGKENKKLHSFPEFKK